MRLASFGILAVLLMGCGESPRVDRALALTAVWQLVHPSGTGSAVPIACEPIPKTGAGTQLYRVTMLTAKHVDAPNATGVKADQQMHNGFIVAKHPTLDAALITFASPFPVRCVKLATERPLPGDDLWGAGYGGSAPLLWVTRGVYCGGNRATYNIVPGDSGGGAFNERGELVGVIVRAYVYDFSDGWPRITTFHNEFVSVSSLQGWLKDQAIPGLQMSTGTAR